MKQLLKVDYSSGELNRYAGKLKADEIDFGVLPGVIISDFDYNDLNASPVITGIVPNGKTIHKCEVEIISAFDDEAKITVGDVIGNASLMTIDEVELTKEAKYLSEPGITVTSDTTYYIYLASGIPTIGNGKIKIYYQ